MGLLKSGYIFIPASFRNITGQASAGIQITQQLEIAFAAVMANAA